MTWKKIHRSFGRARSARQFSTPVIARQASWVERGLFMRAKYGESAEAERFLRSEIELLLTMLNGAE